MILSKPFYRKSRYSLAMLGFVMAALLLFSATPVAHAKPNPNATPLVFVTEVVDELIAAIREKTHSGSRSGTLTQSQIHEVVTNNILPYANLEKTTRLAAGKYWRQASSEQQKELVTAFRETLVRTYSGALTRVDATTSMKTLPFRGDENANDAVVQSEVVESTNTAPIRIDYRLEKTPQGWKIYDINVENIWLIQNYRNQFAQEIERGGIDGLIQALNKRNSSR